MNSVFAALPQFEVSQIRKIGSVVRYSGVVKNLATFSRAKPGWIVVVCVNENKFIKGRFADINSQDYQATIDVSDLDSQNYLVAGQKYPLLDGYWGKLTELVFDNSIMWKKAKFQPHDTVAYHPDGSVENVKDGWDHEHCKICSQNIGTSETDEHDGYVNQNDDWLCESCYQKYVLSKSLGFINLEQLF